MKDKLCGKPITELVGLRLKTYSYLLDNGSSYKIAKGTKKCVIKWRHRFEDVTEKVSKIALSSNDDRRLQTFNGIASYVYRASPGKVCKT